MPGRKRKPTALKVLEGTFRKDRANLKEPKPTGDLLKAPAHFNKKQQAVWDYAIDNAPKGLLKLLILASRLFSNTCMLEADSSRLPASRAS